jgi:hypothetical protein
MICTTFVLFPQASVAVHLRAMVRVAPQALVTLSVKPTVALPQVSLAVADPVAAGAVLLPHSTIKLGGTETAGALVSCTVMV